MASTQFEPGAPVKEGFVPLCVPYLAGNEWAYVKNCFDEGWVSSVGAYVDRFEHDLAAYIGAKHGIAVSTGTASLHVALMVAGVERDDEVLVSNLTFIAPVNTIHYIGAHPVFIDAEPNYWQMDVQKVADFLNQECVFQAGQLTNKTTGRRVKALLPVHILGHPVDMDPLMALAQQYNLKIVADATESLGTLYQGRPVSEQSDIACFSFNGNKIMTTGSGGMITTNDDAWAKKAKYLTTQAKDDPIEYIHEEVGYNYRLSNIHAAMGCAQLEQMPRFVAKKRDIAATYSRALKDVPGITVMPEAPWARSTFWLYTLLVDEAQYGMNGRELMKKLQANKIQSRPLWRPMHMLTPYKNAQAYRIENSERLYHQALSLPSSVGLTADEQQRVIDAICER